MYTVQAMCHYYVIFSGILAASGTTERGRGTVSETEIAGPLGEGHAHLTSGTGDTPGQTRLHTDHHGDGCLRPVLLKIENGKRREFPCHEINVAQVNF